MISFHQILRKIITQITILFIVVLLNILAHFGVIPDINNLTIILKELFEDYGYPLMAICAFFENLAGINIYFPGAVVILIAMSLSSGDPLKAIITWFCYVIPFFLAHHLNYISGNFTRRKGIHNDKEQAFTSRFGKFSRVAWFLSTFWHPHFSAVTSVAAGEMGYSYSEYIRYLLIAGTIWNLFYGITLYYFGGIAEATSNLMPLFYIYIVIWAIWDIRQLLKDSKK